MVKHYVYLLKSISADVANAARCSSDGHWLEFFADIFSIFYLQGNLNYYCFFIKKKGD